MKTDYSYFLRWQASNLCDALLFNVDAGLILATVAYRSEKIIIKLAHDNPDFSDSETAKDILSEFGALQIQEISGDTVYTTQSSVEQDEIVVYHRA